MGTRKFSVGKIKHASVYVGVCTGITVRYMAILKNFVGEIIAIL